MSANTVSKRNVHRKTHPGGQPHYSLHAVSIGKCGSRASSRWRIMSLDSSYEKGIENSRRCQVRLARLGHCLVPSCVCTQAEWPFLDTFDRKNRAPWRCRRLGCKHSRMLVLLHVSDLRGVNKASSSASYTE